jgi:hypothetical protein
MNIALNAMLHCIQVLAHEVPSFFFSVTSKIIKNGI